MTTVQAPDGSSVEFPDDLPPAQIKAAMAKRFGGPTAPVPVAIDHTVTQNINQNKPAPGGGFLENMGAGFDISATGIANRIRENNRSPVTMLPEDAPLGAKIAYMAGQAVGDLPATVAGFVAGGAAGSAAGPVGTLVGGGALAAATPTAIRETYINLLQNGKVKNFDDFWARSASVAIETGKQAVIGGISAPIGGAVGGRVLAQVGVVLDLAFLILEVDLRLGVAVFG